MAVRPNAKMCVIAEQIIEDGCGLTFQFEVKRTIRNGKEVDETVLRIFGDLLPHGNREIFFGEHGEEVGAGTYTRGLCKPTWQTRVDGSVEE